VCLMLLVFFYSQCWAKIDYMQTWRSFLYVYFNSYALIHCKTTAYFCCTCWLFFSSSEHDALRPKCSIQFVFIWYNSFRYHIRYRAQPIIGIRHNRQTLLISSSSSMCQAYPFSIKIVGTLSFLTKPKSLVYTLC